VAGKGLALLRAKSALGVSLDVGAGAALVTTLFLPWASSGNGSLLVGNELGRVLAERGRTAMAVAVYAVALAGGAVIALAGDRGRTARAGRTVVGLALMAGLAWLAGHSLPLDRWAAAPAMTLGAAIIAMARGLARPKVAPGT
jgi:hypothetical protein